MKLKILLGFAAGVALTSGMFYIASKKHAPAAVKPVPAAQALPAAPLAAPAAAPPPLVEPARPAVEALPPKMDTEKKPSAVVVRRRAQRPAIVQVAQNRSPSEPVSAPEPSSEPAPHPADAAAVPTPAPAVVEPEPAPAEAPAPPPPAAPEPHSVTLGAGSLLTVRVGQTISSDQNVAGDAFSGTLEQPLIIDGFIIAERGSRVQGRVVEVDRAGRVKGRALVSVELTRLHTSDGQDIRIQTQPFEKRGSKSTGEDAAKIGVGAAIGAMIGAMAGGGKGAGIGAGVGGAAGAGTVMATRGKPAVIPVETRLSFRVQEPVAITERLQ